MFGEYVKNLLKQTIQFNADKVCKKWRITMSKAKDIQFKQLSRQERKTRSTQRQIASELYAEGQEAIQNRNQKN